MHSFLKKERNSLLACGQRQNQKYTVRGGQAVAAAAGGSCESELFVAASWCRSLRAKSPHRMQALAKVKPAGKYLG